jgi:hypothetical protein
LWRRRRDRFERVDAGANLFRSWITSIYRDRGGRLWWRRTARLFRFDTPEGPFPLPRGDDRDGLSTSTSQRRRGFWHLGDEQIQRLLARPPGVEHFTTADGLPGGRLTVIFGDAEGRIWVAGEAGIALLQPIARAPAPRADVAFDEVDVSGDRMPIPLRGLNRIAGLALPADRNSLRFRVASVDWESRRTISYRYRLDAKSPWGTVPADRTIVLPLRPVSARGRASIRRHRTDPQPPVLDRRASSASWSSSSRQRAPAGAHLQRAAAGTHAVERIGPRSRRISTTTGAGLRGCRAREVVPTRRSEDPGRRRSSIAQTARDLVERW